MPQLGNAAFVAILVTIMAAIYSAIQNLFAKLRGYWSDQRLVVEQQLDIERLRRELAEKVEELAQARKDNSMAGIKAKEMGNTVNQQNGELTRTKKRKAELEAELGRLQNQNKTHVDQLERQSTMLKAAMEDARHTRAQLDKMAELLKTRTSELKGAQEFLTKADLISCADLVDMVEGLNGEIVQTAAFMADSFEFEGVKERMEETEGLREACIRMSAFVGDRMVQLLRSTEHSDDPMLIQIALQGVMVLICDWVISSWCIEDSGKAEFLRLIYFGVRESDSTVSGRWRALTRLHARRMFQEQPGANQLLMHHCTHELASLLMVAGCKQTHLQIQESILAKFAERLDVLGKSSVRINKAIGEDITSCETFIFVPKPTEKFNSATMDDALGNKDTRPEVKEEPVLCTTELGLWCRVADNSGDASRWKEIALLKPHVLLESALEEMRSDERGA